MKVVWAIILTSLLILTPVLGATVSSTFSAQGVGALIRSSDINWGSSIDNTTVGGNAGSVLLTAPGESRALAGVVAAVPGRVVALGVVGRRAVRGVLWIVDGIPGRGVPPGPIGASSAPRGTIRIVRARSQPKNSESRLMASRPFRLLPLPRRP